ncbi:hypothetical protein CRG98_006754 [Punica granatum]|uniref:Uncharacterized protein n=1 Tax=Punica granatum TaxID=22663 RepID=A0A2I0KYG7_PUNGR|nr:hypothetical protein CRG98_006754 [Punica granatum]
MARKSSILLGGSTVDQFQPWDHRTRRITKWARSAARPSGIQIGLDRPLDPAEYKLGHDRPLDPGCTDPNVDSRRGPHACDLKSRCLGVSTFCGDE